MRSIYSFALLILSANSVLACETPTGADFKSPATEYARSHKVSYLRESLVEVNDSLIIWDRTNESLCFHFETIHTNAHLCWLTGTATRIGPNLYEYKDAKCHVQLAVQDARIRVRVNDPSQPERHFCNPADTEEYACGMNTGIGPGVFPERVNDIATPGCLNLVSMG